MDDPVGQEEVGFLKSKRGEAEVGQGGQDGFGVANGRADQQIDIAGIAGGPMKGQGVGADNQVFNAVGVEQCEQFFEVGLQFHLVAFGGVQRRQCGRRGVA